MGFGDKPVDLAELRQKNLEERAVKLQDAIDNGVDKAMGAFCRGLIFVGVTQEQIQQAALKAGEFVGE
jgi:hypothetical protein